VGWWTVIAVLIALPVFGFVVGRWWTLVVPVLLGTAFVAWYLADPDEGSDPEFALGWTLIVAVAFVLMTDVGVLSARVSSGTIRRCPKQARERLRKGGGKGAELRGGGRVSVACERDPRAAD
jgi:hypothetical protein